MPLEVAVIFIYRTHAGITFCKLALIRAVAADPMFIILVGAVLAMRLHVATCEVFQFRVAKLRFVTKAN